MPIGCVLSVEQKRPNPLTLFASSFVETPFAAETPLCSYRLCHWR